MMMMMLDSCPSHYINGRFLLLTSSNLIEECSYYDQLSFWSNDYQQQQQQQPPPLLVLLLQSLNVDEDGRTFILKNKQWR
ncbi:hypothetical protein DERF_008288 [Dermatophagoides farinae]|uniref:Uncharacterized protein n=1 Tax=Dermatophagoides farinae TaxID=6954 RepID=A0A922L6U2_DERFA|nr:hypothetical protein DERF_008288 [Dermatophagoides farinae]